MRAFWTIVRRDLTGYFLSPIVYTIATVFLLLTGLLFFSNLLVYQDVSFSINENPYISQSLSLANDFLRPLSAQYAVILLFFLPILTMRSFSEEKRNGTLELLLTYPVSDAQAIAGKFFAVVITICSILILTLIYPGLLFLWSKPDIGPLIANYVGLVGLICVFSAIGIFASSMTENQIVSALIAFGINLVFWMIGWASPESSGVLHDILKHLSIIEHFEPAIKGLIRLADMTYFVTLTTLFLFLTGRILESKRWRG